MKHNSQGGNVQLPTTPLPQGSVGGVALGDPSDLGEPPALEVGSLMTSPASSNVSNTSYQQTPSKKIPGKLALCKCCGCQSEDLATCVRCKRRLPEDVKLLDDPAFKPKPDSTLTPTSSSSISASPSLSVLDKNKALRGVRLPSKQRKRNNADEPVTIDLSDSEEEGEDLDEAETVEESSGECHDCFNIRTLCFDTIRTIEADELKIVC